MNFDEPNWLDVWIEREFSGYGRAIREKTDPPYLGEPYMSMGDAKALTRRAVAEDTERFRAGYRSIRDWQDCALTAERRVKELEAGFEQILTWHEQLPQDQKTVRLAREMLGRLDETETREPEPEKASRLTYCRVCDDDVLPGSWLMCAYDACPFVPKEHGISEEPG